MTGNDQSDVLNGAGGYDTLIGGACNDTYIIDELGPAGLMDVIFENANEGIDRIETALATLSIQGLAANVEELFGTSTTGQQLTGNAGDNVIQGNTGNDTLAGGAGLNILRGGRGDDTYIVTTGTDQIIEYANEGWSDRVLASISFSLQGFANVESLELTGTSNLDAYGNEFTNVLVGNSGLNKLYGSASNDVYYVQNTGDEVIEVAGEGNDLVFASANFTLGANVERLTLEGGALVGTGNTLSNMLTGNALNNQLWGLDGDDTLDGGAGQDTLRGGAGNDRYVVDALTDVVIEDPSSGTATISTSITTYSIALIANVENLSGSSLNGGQTLTGNSLLNFITGTAYNDVLDGGTGTEVDTLSGGDGNDTYVIRASTDVVQVSNGN